MTSRKHLAPFLPFELTGAVGGKKVVLTGLNESTVKTKPVIPGASKYEDFIPLMRDWSELIKEIEIDGKKFVPMDRIYARAIESIYGYVPDHSFEVVESNEGDGFGIITRDEADGLRNGFSFNIPTVYKNWCEFRLSVNNAQTSTPQYMMINQIQLFELLYKWHFPVGMPENSWIDINTY